MFVDLRSIALERLRVENSKADKLKDDQTPASGIPDRTKLVPHRDRCRSSMSG